MDYEVIATGSDGNAVRIEHIMIDCGIPFVRMKESLYKCDTLLITHSHTDHIKHVTFERIRKEFPRIQIYANADVAYRYPVDHIIGTKPFRIRRALVHPYEGKHDVPVTYFIIEIGGKNVFYGTDSCEFENPAHIPLDYVFCESNYDERKLRELGKQYARRGYDPTLSSLRHFSTQQCKEFYFVNRRDRESKLIELHMSKRFY